MEYQGKLYGKIGGKYFDTGKTTDEWDKLQAIAGQVDAIVNRQNRFIIEDASDSNGCVYFILEGDPFERNYTKRFNSLIEAKVWIAFKIGG